MWLFREVFRLIWMIAVATAIATAIGVLLALFSSRDLSHALRVSFLLVGCLLLLFAGAGNRSTASARRVNWGPATAVFVGSAAALIALGLLV